MKDLLKSTLTMIAVILLAGCGSPEPVVNTVKKNQDYMLPNAFTATGIKASVELAHKMCGARTEGCLVYNDNGSFTIYYTEANILVHEIEHLAYGPEHY